MRSTLHRLCTQPQKWRQDAAFVSPVYLNHSIRAVVFLLPKKRSVSLCWRRAPVGYGIQKDTGKRRAPTFQQTEPIAPGSLPSYEQCTVYL